MDTSHFGLRVPGPLTSDCTSPQRYSILSQGFRGKWLSSSVSNGRSHLLWSVSAILDMGFYSLSLLLLYVYTCFACTYMYATCIPGPWERQRGVSDPLDVELELEMIMNRHMGDGDSAREPRTPALLFIRKRIINL